MIRKKSEMTDAMWRDNLLTQSVAAAAAAAAAAALQGL